MYETNIRKESTICALLNNVFVFGHTPSMHMTGPVLIHERDKLKGRTVKATDKYDGSIAIHFPTTIVQC